MKEELDSFQSLKKLKRSVSGALGRKECNSLPLDNNWVLSRSVPNSLNNGNMSLQRWSSSSPSSPDQVPSCSTPNSRRKQLAVVEILTPLAIKKQDGFLPHQQFTSTLVFLQQHRCVHLSSSKIVVYLNAKFRGNFCYPSRYCNYQKVFKTKHLIKLVRV